MQNHNYILLQTPEDLLKFANYCINTKYYHCGNCGFQLLSLLEEIIGGPGGSYEKLYMNYYFINNKIVRWEDYEGLTCNEIVVKLLME